MTECNAIEQRDLIFLSKKVLDRSRRTKGDMRIHRPNFLVNVLEQRVRIYRSSRHDGEWVAKSCDAAGDECLRPNRVSRASRATLEVRNNPNDVKVSVVWSI